jgi:hypothetical protein
MQRVEYAKEIPSRIVFNLQGVSADDRFRWRSVVAAGPYARVSSPGKFPVRTILHPWGRFKTSNSVPKILKREWSG